MAKKKFQVSADDAWEGTNGVCLACGNIQSGCEPDARNYECEACGAKQVFGIEEAVMMDAIELIGSEAEEDEWNDDDSEGEEH